MDRVQLKAIAKQQIQGNIGILFVCLLITSVLSGLIPGLTTLIVGPPLTLGLTMIFLGLTRDESPEINTLFSGFSYMGPAILLNCNIYLFMVFAFCHSGNHQGDQLFHGILCFS